MGDALSRKDALRDPDIDLAWQQLKAQMPEETARIRSVAPMGPIRRFFHPKATALTSPFGNITYNADLIRSAHMRPDDTLAHELVHAGQFQKQGLLKSLWSLVSPPAQEPYYEPEVGQNLPANEKEAYDRERVRRSHRRDIELPVAGLRKAAQ